jgi:uncharacterized protein YceK
MKRFILLLFMVVMFSGCGWVASQLPELSEEQRMAIAGMADEKIRSEIAKHGEGQDNPYLPIAGGAGAGAVTLALLKLYEAFRKKYKKS